MRLHYTKAMALVDDNFNAESDGLFKGYAAATGNVDLGGDIILKAHLTNGYKHQTPPRARTLAT